MELDYATHCIPAEICTHILAYLPVKSLLRFRSVSKEWKSIIDNRDFASLHLTCYSNNRLETTIIALEYPGDKELRPRWFSRSPLPQHYQQTSEFDYSVPSDIFIPRNPYSIIAGAAHGLLLLVQGNVGKLNQGDVVLWNPSIRKSLNIPLPPSSPSFDLELCLGFDPSTNDYKVVNMVRGFQITTLEIFSLISGLWRKGRRFTVGNEVPNRAHSHQKSRKVHFQGFVHWVVSNYYVDRESWKSFISLNLTSDTLSQTQLPVAPYPINYLHESTECPIVVDGKAIGLLTASVDICAIWMLESDGQWSKRFSLNFPDWDLPNTLVYLNKDGVLLTVKSSMWDRSICACDMNTGYKSVVLQLDSWPMYFGAYIESLVLLS